MTEATLIPAPADAPPQQTPAPSSSLTDLRQLAMGVPTAVMQAALAEYVEKRKTLREWLLDQMEEGVHYGVPPGCEPRSVVNPRQWKHKPSLYKAGAELVIDLMGLRQEYEADAVAWQQMGSEKGTAVFKCRLISRATGQEVGQGVGAGKVGRKSADENKAVKDAQKRAMVAAVLNAYGLSDLFVADLEDYAPPAYENPTMNPAAPLAPTRSARPAKPAQTAAPSPRRIAVAKIMDEWRQQFGGDGPAFWKWFDGVAKSQSRPKTPEDWSDREIDLCRQSLGIMPPEEKP